MNYTHYKVVSCGLDKQPRSIALGNYVDRTFYRCELVGCDNGHKISFSLMIEGCVASEDLLRQYEVIAHHINIGDIFSCEFAWKKSTDMRDYILVLCLQGLQKQTKGRLYSGYWLRPPGLIPCDGESILKIDFPQRLSTVDCLKQPESGRLVWVPTPKPSFRKRIASRLSPRPTIQTT